MDEFAPTMLVEHDNPNSRFSLILDPSGPICLTTKEVFERHSLDAGGYARQGVVDGLVRPQTPGVAGRVKYDPETSMFAAYGNDRDALKRMAELIREVPTNPAMLEKALQTADPNRLD